jgi:hypothetical protein
MNKDYIKIRFSDFFHILMCTYIVKSKVVDCTVYQKVFQIPFLFKQVKRKNPILLGKLEKRSTFLFSVDIRLKEYLILTIIILESEIFLFSTNISIIIKYIFSKSCTYYAVLYPICSVLLPIIACLICYS